MQTAFKKQHLTLCVVSLFCATACTTPSYDATPITQAERNQRDQALGTELARQFDTQLEFKKDAHVTTYLQGLAKKLTGTTPELHTAGIDVLLIKDSNGAWRDYSLPGHRLYLSVSLLKKMEFENQVAAAMAFEFAHILKRHALTRLQEEVLRMRKGEDEKSVSRGVTGAASPFSTDYPSIEGLVPSASDRAHRSVEYVGTNGVLNFPDDLNEETVETAVEILYQAGFDPRGLVSLWEIYLSEPKASPYGKDLLAKLTERTRRAIALHAPLRNPIVRSQSFLMVQKRIQGL